MHKFIKWVVPGVALLILVLMLVPADFWDQPNNDAVYQGFDSNLVYINQEGQGSTEGVVQISPESLKLIAVPYSQPTVHLMTTTLNFTTAMNISAKADGDGQPGEVVSVSDDGVSVQAKGGRIMVKRVRPKGGQKQSAAEWVAAAGVSAGTKLGS